MGQVIAEAEAAVDATRREASEGRADSWRSAVTETRAQVTSQAHVKQHLSTSIFFAEK